VQKIVGQLALSVLLTLPAYAFDYGTPIETVQNPGKPNVEIVQDTVAFQPLDEPAQSAKAKPEKARVPRTVNQTRSHTHTATRVHSAPGATSANSSDANTQQAPLAYDSGNEPQSPFSALAKIFGSANK
jgi:hypothetical protein